MTSQFLYFFYSYVFPTLRFKRGQIFFDLAPLGCCMLALPLITRLKVIGIVEICVLPFTNLLQQFRLLDEMAGSSI
jgi:hypothetical protein